MTPQIVIGYPPKANQPWGDKFTGTSRKEKVMKRYASDDQADTVLLNRPQGCSTDPRVPLGVIRALKEAAEHENPENDDQKIEQIRLHDQLAILEEEIEQDLVADQLAQDLMKVLDPYLQLDSPAAVNDLLSRLAKCREEKSEDTKNAQLGNTIAELLGS